MKKLILVGLVVLLGLSACGVLGSDETPADAAPVDIAATVDVVASTQVAQTFEALENLSTPTKEDVAPEPTITSSPTEEILPSETPTLAETETPDGTEAVDVTPDAESALPAETVTGTPDGTLTVTGTVEATATSIYPSPTSPIQVNQPPAHIPRFKIKIQNNTKYRVYISLQGVTEGGYHPITEYDLAPWEKTKFPIPEGRYTAIVYVGKDPMVESFGIHGNNEVTIVIEKERLKIDK